MRFAVRFLILLCIVGTLSAVFYLIFDGLGLLSQDGLAEFIQSGDMYFLYVAIFVIQSCCLCFIPGNTMVYCAVGVLLFGPDALLTIIALNVIGAACSSQALFFIGRFGGRGLIGLLFGDGSLDRMLTKLNERGHKILPIYYLLLFLPDDLLCLTCGTSEMSWKKFTALNLVFRSLGVTILTILFFYILPYVEIIWDMIF